MFDDGGDYVVYKIEAVEALPVAGVRDEITRRLAMERETAVRNTMQKSTKLNDAYFPPAPAAPPTLRNPGEPAPAAPPAPGKK